MKKIMGMMMALGVVLILGGCGADKTDQAVQPAVTDTQGTVEKAANHVEIAGYTFSPAVLTIKKGETVTWTNSDTAPHTIKFAAFSSENLSDGQSFSFTFANAGIFDYYCSVHPAMTGKIIVE